MFYLPWCIVSICIKQNWRIWSGEKPHKIELWPLCMVQITITWWWDHWAELLQKWTLSSHYREMIRYWILVPVLHAIDLKEMFHKLLHTVLSNIDWRNNSVKLIQETDLSIWDYRRLYLNYFRWSMPINCRLCYCIENQHN